MWLQVRQILSDFAVLISIVVMVAIDILIGVATPKLEVPEKFQVSGRSSLIITYGRGFMSCYLS